jgi:hypothetical protein
VFDAEVQSVASVRHIALGFPSQGILAARRTTCWAVSSQLPPPGGVGLGELADGLTHLPDPGYQPVAHALCVAFIACQLFS